MNPNENQPVAQVTPNPDPSPASAVADDVEAAGEVSGKKEPHPSIAHVRQEWPEDAYVAWKREHQDRENPCPDSDGCHCAFMAGIAYAEEVILSSQSNAAGAPPVSPAPSPVEHVRQMERDNTTMQIYLRAADKMAWICDDWVQRHVIDARSALADARLSYGEPFKYLWSKRVAPSVSNLDNSPATSVESPETLRDVITKLAEHLTCGKNDTHFCSKCDNSLFTAKHIADEALSSPVSSVERDKKDSGEPGGV